MSKQAQVTPESYVVAREGKKWYVTLNGMPVLDSYKTKTAADAAVAHELEALAAATPVLDAAAIAAMDKVDRLQAVKVERAAVKLWQQGSPTGTPDPDTRPDTPVLNWMNSTPATVRNARKSSKRPSSGTSTSRNPEQQTALMALIAERRTAGDSWAKVALALDSAGIATRSGKPWDFATVHAMAKREGMDTARTASPAPEASAKPAAKAKAEKVGSSAVKGTSNQAGRQPRKPVAADIPKTPKASTFEAEATAMLAAVLNGTPRRKRTRKSA